MSESEIVQALLPGRIGLLVRLNAAPGRRAALLDALNRYSDGLDEEPGTEMFTVHVDPDDGNTVWLYEIFRDTDAQNDHRGSAGFLQVMSEIPGLLDCPPGVLRLDPLRMTLQDSLLREDLSL